MSYRQPRIRFDTSQWTDLQLVPYQRTFSRRALNPIDPSEVQSADDQQSERLFPFCWCCFVLFCFMFVCLFVLSSSGLSSSSSCACLFFCFRSSWTERQATEVKYKTLPYMYIISSFLVFFADCRACIAVCFSICSWCDGVCGSWWYYTGSTNKVTSYKILSTNP